jgi:hypothetical protein
MKRMKLMRTLNKKNKFMRLVRKYLTPFSGKKMRRKSKMKLKMKMILIIQIFLRHKLLKKLIKKKRNRKLMLYKIKKYNMKTNKVMRARRLKISR